MLPESKDDPWAGELCILSDNERRFDSRRHYEVYFMQNGMIIYNRTIQNVRNIYIYKYATRQCSDDAFAMLTASHPGTEERGCCDRSMEVGSCGWAAGFLNPLPQAQF